MIAMQKYLTTEDAAQRLKVKPAWIRRLCAQGRLGQKVGRDYVITPTDIDRFRQNRRAPGRPKSNGK